MRRQMAVTDPVTHQVFQRDSEDRATVPFSLSIPDGIAGRVEVRTHTLPWTTVGRIERETGRFAGVIKNVSTGRHTVFARMVGEIDEEVVAESETGPIYVGDLWLLAGQSNMEGCGKLIDVEEPQTGVSCFYFGDRWDIAVEPLSWQLESDDPVHWNDTGDRETMIRSIRKDRELGSGLGLSFGKQLLHHTGIPVGLVMVAHGGTSMAQWDPALADQGGCSLYGSMLRVVRAVGGKVKGCLWYQGESDTTDEAAPHYYDRFKQFAESLRSDLQDSGLPIIYAQLAAVMTTIGTLTSWPEETQWNRIQYDQVKLEEELDAVALVPTIDSKLDDFIHLSTESLREVGKRMAWAALRIAYGRPVAEIGPRLSRTSWNSDRTKLLLEFSGVNRAFQPVQRVFGCHITSGSSTLPLTAMLTEDNCKIVLCLEAPAPAGCSLWHGKGLNPAVNSRDELGYPLVVFGPVPV